MNPHRFFRRQVNRTQQQVEDSISRSLSQTSVKNNVEDYLQKEKMLYSVFGIGVPMDNVNGRSIAEIASVNAPIQTWILAEIPDAEIGFLFF
jgi:hypothetical protein